MSNVAVRKSENAKRLAIGLGFLAPNIIGFLVFTLIPLGFSLVMAFTNWDLRLHNQFRSEPLKFIGFDNFLRLFNEPNFWRYLGNTLFLMIGIPFSIAGSLILALLLSREPKEVGAGRLTGAIFGGAVVVVAGLLLFAFGSGASGTAILLAVIGGSVLLAGVIAGSSVYRTLFYLPAFTSGVATILLWKNLFNPTAGPINSSLTPILGRVTAGVNGTPAGVVQSLFWIGLAVTLGIMFFGLARLRRMWIEGELGASAAVMPVVVLVLPILLPVVSYFVSLSDVLKIQFPFLVSFPRFPGLLPTLVVLAAVAAMATAMAPACFRREFPCKRQEGFGTAFMMCAFLMVLEFVVVSLSIAAYHLPMAAKDGLEPPGWHTQYDWAKPAIMIIGFWAAIGSNNMLLYLAGLSGIPAELYEAADLDGTSPLQRFWNVTWPQLAPTTFFIVVMSIIGGLQGGFEIARTMTLGGPDGATTTLSYFIYTEGFETGRLGYSSAVAWSLFVMVMLVTLFNWKFGNRYVND